MIFVSTFSKIPNKKNICASIVFKAESVQNNEENFSGGFSVKTKKNAFLVFIIIKEERFQCDEVFAFGQASKVCLWSSVKVLPLVKRKSFAFG